MKNQDPNRHVEFYNQTIARIDSVCSTPDDLCFVYVQHAFTPLLTHLSCLGNRLAALIPKASSSRSNRAVVKQLEQRFPGKVFDNINRAHLCNTDFTISLLKRVTQGRPFAILEYGAYFAPSAKAIADDPELGLRLVGIVEGTENGVKGSDDKSTVGYQHMVHEICTPVISKSKSRIKQIMDQDIGPAIIESCNNILQRSAGSGIAADFRTVGTVGVVGLGSIGRGILKNLTQNNIQPLVSDSNLAVLAEHANSQHAVVTLETLLSNSDLIFLNTGSCFLSQRPELLARIKDEAILVLCTSGDVEAGIPQLIAANHLTPTNSQVNKDIATYQTQHGKSCRIMLGGDGVGQAPNLVVESGTNSLASLMSDMEFYALGCYLASHGTALPTGCINESPDEIQNLILEQWLQVFHSENRAQLSEKPNSSSSSSKQGLHTVPTMFDQTLGQETLY